MKRLRSIAALCLMAVSMSVNAQLSKVALQHDGSLTLYGSDAISTAISAAVAGDTIYLNEGTFTGGFTIDKKLTIIGAGENTIISGNVTLSISGTPTLTARLLDGLNISGRIIVSAACSGLTIRKCTFAGIYFAANTSDAVIESCFCTGDARYYSNSDSYASFMLNSYVKSLTVVNSKIYTLIGCGATNDAASFINCNIYRVQGVSSSGSSYSSNYPAFVGVVLNSIIYTGTSYSASYYYVSPNAALNNVLYSSSYVVTYSNNTDCTYYASLLGTDCECNLTTSELESNGYFGNDGTVVGIYGGTTPYSLTPNGPAVESSTISVDTENKKLNVSLKVTAN